MTSAGTTQSPSAARQTAALTALGVVADVAALAQLLVSGPQMGILVAGVLAALSGIGGLIRRFGEPIGPGALVMAALIAIGAGTAGVSAERLLSDQAALGPASQSRTLAPGPSGPVASEPVAGDTGSTGPSSAALPSPSPSASVAPDDGAKGTPAPARGAVVNQGRAVLVDLDYLDLEGGVISEVNDAADITYNAPYKEIWTKGGGALWITPFSGEPSMAQCEDRLRSRHYGSVSVEQGGWFCVETAQKNIGAGQFVKAAERDGEELTLAYIVWRR
ncbi:hypothetical protein [Streptosporangium sp. KLBMP 9127]|nr:hypothetical protein [Streptosporangium sp. KLBMP 9127]